MRREFALRMGKVGTRLLMALYSLSLLLICVVGSPYWVFRMLTSGRYRAGLWNRLGRIPEALRQVVSGKDVVWLHAVSVGEVLAATRLVSELEEALNTPQSGLQGNWIIVVSTTTATGQALARERFRGPKEDPAVDNAARRVFWYPLDFAWAVRRYLFALRPKMLVLMESELWPRMLVECAQAKIPVVVVNARVSDRSLARGLKLRPLWRQFLGRVSLFAAQSEEDARRLVAMGALGGAVLATGNLKYDVRAPKASRMAERIATIAEGRSIIVAGSTVAAERGGSSEDEMVVDAWKRDVSPRLATLLVIAPRHPQRFGEVAELLLGTRFARASEIVGRESAEPVDVVLLDTIGDLAAIYSVANVAFIGGSLISRGGHNPLEAARFGVPVITGPSTTNFREIYRKLAEDDACRTVSSSAELGRALAELLENPSEARAIGQRGLLIFEREQGATKRTVNALMAQLRSGRRPCP